LVGGLVGGIARDTPYSCHWHASLFLSRKWICDKKNENL